ncbi:autotransporter outer membrane beta-barrel domain-containing protein [Escherichia coli]
MISVWCLRADVAAELRSLRRDHHLSNGMESKSVDTRSIYRELGATLSYNMRLGTVWKLNLLKAAVRKEFVDDNRAKVNSDGNFVNDLSGRRGIYQEVSKPHSAVR